MNKETNIELYLIRHGKSEANAFDHERISGRSPETVLSFEGAKQSTLLGLRLAGESPFDAIYSSTLIRARQTYQLCLVLTSFPLDQVIEDELLVEQSQGAWENRIRAEVYTPELLVRMNSIGKFFREGYEMESQAMVELRAATFLHTRILQQPEFCEKPVKIAIFSHCQFIRSMFHYILGSNDRLIHRIRLDNTSITKLGFDHFGWSIGYINDSAHLREPNEELRKRILVEEFEKILKEKIDPELRKLLEGGDKYGEKRK